MSFHRPHHSNKAMKRRSKVLWKLYHKTHVFSTKNVSQLQKCLDVYDIVSILFLMCNSDLRTEIYNLMCHLNRFGASNFDLYRIVARIPDWERKLLESLSIINHKSGLFSLGIRFEDVSTNLGHMVKNVSSSKILLFRIFENLKGEETKNFVEEMQQLDAPTPSVPLKLLEIYFSFWHLTNFIDLDAQNGFEMVASALRSIGRGDLAGTLGVQPEAFHFNSVFDNDFPIEAYEIKHPENVGLCVIVNQVLYGTAETDRDSSLRDEQRLTDLMTGLNFEVRLLRDVSAAELCDQIKTCILDNFSTEHSMLMLVVLAHGADGFIICPLENTEEIGKSANPPGNGDFISFRRKTDNEEMWKTGECTQLGFVSIKSLHGCLFGCEQLNKVPKVVILNCCRGSAEFSNLQYFKADFSLPSEPTSHMNLLTCFTTLPGFVSFRDRSLGSLFISVFCDILTKRPDTEACELFTLINVRLMQPTADLSKAFELGRPDQVCGRANPFEFVSSLTKKLHFQMPKVL